MFFSKYEPTGGHLVSESGVEGRVCTDWADVGAIGLGIGAIESGGCRALQQSCVEYRGTSLIRKRPPPQDPPRTVGIGLR